MRDSGLGVLLGIGFLAICGAILILWFLVPLLRSPF